MLCGVAGVAVVDEQRIYDPNDQDDKLLLELKGTMSEAEIHWLRLRLQGARQHKARRGALRMPAPTGYLWGERGFELDPDEAVQRAVRVIFQRYDVEPSAWAVVRWARETGLPGADAPDLGGRGLRGGVEIPRGLAAARHAEEPGLRRRVRVRAPARDDRYWSTDRSAGCVPTRAIRIGGW